jgi:rare lipoprotein A
MRTLTMTTVVLAALCGAPPADTAAQPASDATLATEVSSRGVAWFFAHSPRPRSACSGRHVVATWYSSGRRTASGHAFNSGGHTAAHRTLPFGSRVTVTNPRNGRSVTVVINDRGPFTRGVTLDLARGAARSIGMHSTQWVCMS